MTGLGKMYGIASRTIHAQRNEIQRLRVFIRAARQECTCRAWWHVYDEMRDDDLIRKDLERTKRRLDAAYTVKAFQQEDPRCECHHKWSDHDDGGVCGYTWDAYRPDGTVYKKRCQYAEGISDNGVCQHFRPWRGKTS